MSLSYKQMKEIIEGGESVLVNGKIICHVKDLPHPEELATSPEDVAKAKADIARQIADLQRRLAAVAPDKPKDEPKDAPKAPEKAK